MPATPAFANHGMSMPTAAAAVVSVGVTTSATIVAATSDEPGGGNIQGLSFSGELFAWTKPLSPPTRSRHLLLSVAASIWHSVSNLVWSVPAVVRHFAREVVTNAVR